MNSETVELFGQKLIVHERFALDVLALEERTGSAAEGVMLLAAAISDALKRNWMDAPFYRRRKFKRITTANYLLKNLTVNELLDLKDIIEKLEDAESGGDSKKK